MQLAGSMQVQDPSKDAFCSHVHQRNDSIKIIYGIGRGEGAYRHSCSFCRSNPDLAGCAGRLDLR